MEVSYGVTSRIVPLAGEDLGEAVVERPTPALYYNNDIITKGALASSQGLSLSPDIEIVQRFLGEREA